jgi:CTP:molybdopterin cytidylyltransferase MocA
MSPPSLVTIPAIVLAAGASRRMGRPKCALRIGPSETDTFASRIVSVLAAAGLDPIVVVSNAIVDETLRRALGTWTSRTTLVLNADPDQGQLSSVQCGLGALDERAPAVLVTLVDLPLVRIETVRALMEAWRSTRAPLVRPARSGRHGHPVIVSGSAMAALHAAGPGTSMRTVLQASADRVVDVEMDDDGPFLDIDTPEDYARVVGESFRRM